MRTRKTSTKITMIDVSHWLLISSDPLISSLHLTPPIEREILSGEAVNLLLPAYAYITASECSHQSDTSADMTDDTLYKSD